MKRSKFLELSGLTLLIGFNQFENDLNKQAKDPLDKELVFEFVKAGHNDLKKVKSMLAKNPNLINCSWDWGNGDFETAIGGASHLGNKEIAGFLISHGARINIFTLAMMGELHILQQLIDVYPKTLNAKGPHGFTLLHHARAGGSENEDLVDFLISKGLNETKIG